MNWGPAVFVGAQMPRKWGSKGSWKLRNFGRRCKTPPPPCFPCSPQFPSSHRHPKFGRAKQKASRKDRSRRFGAAGCSPSWLCAEKNRSGDAALGIHPSDNVVMGITRIGFTDLGDFTHPSSSMFKPAFKQPPNRASAL